MKPKKIFVFFVALLAIGCSYAQTNVLKFQPLKFNAPGIEIPYSGNIKNSASINVVLFSPEMHAPAVVDPVVHYPAFFCRMELISVDQLRIWVKIHAGDYDTYSHPGYSH